MMSLDVDEVQSVQNYNDFLEQPHPETPKLVGDGLPTTTTSLNSPEENFQICQNCGRKFFMGKLQYHLKICTKGKPMLRSPAKSEKNGCRQQQACLISRIDPKTPNKPATDSLKIRATKMWECPSCNIKVPFAIVDYHREHCSGAPVQYHSEQVTPRISHSQAQRSVLPRITKNVDPIKIRQQLSCFSRAANIQQVQCQFCNRKFEKNAALRHIPVCEKVSDTKDLKIKKKIQIHINLRTGPKVIGKHLIEECQSCHRNISGFHQFCGFCGVKRNNQPNKGMIDSSSKINLPNQALEG